MKTMKEATHIGIIGMGPRGLSILERIAERLQTVADEVPLVLHLIDTNPCGQGSHSARQPNYLFTNTVASQVSMFAPNSFVGGKDGISFTQWAAQCGYRKFGHGFFRVEDLSGEPITDHDYLPRRMLGEYLSWTFDLVMKAMPSNISVKRHLRCAVALAESTQAITITLDNGFTFAADYVFLTTGHSKRAPDRNDMRYQEFVANHGKTNVRLDYFPTPYPTERLARISPQATVAVQGLGLTAYDVIAELTTGRGGKFEDSEEQLRYIASGLEPKILLFSRNCLPFAARGINQKGIAGRYKAAFFTVDAVQAIRAEVSARTGSGEIDFVIDLLPLIEKEMAYAYRSALTGARPDPADFSPTPEEQREVARLLRPLADLRFQSFSEFRDYFIGTVEKDLAEAFKGNVDSPVKAATDALRDTREALRRAVEFRGLTPSSHRIYVEDFVATTNRISFGPPKFRNVEMLALMRAGVLDVAGGPGCKLTLDAEAGRFSINNQYPCGPSSHSADVLVVARLDPYSPETDASPLTASLMQQGLVRPFKNGSYHGSGLDIDEAMRPIRADGTAHGRMWAVGYPVEGAHFYTHALPRPLMASRFTQDAHRCVEQLFDAILPQARLDKKVPLSGTVPEGDQTDTACSEAKADMSPTYGSAR